MKFPSKRKPRTIRVDPEACIYAIGDVHGQLDLLDRLLERIHADRLARPTRPKARRIIFLGDIIDRGPDSLGCLQRVDETMRQHGAELVLGNHEDLLLRSVDGHEKAQEVWMQHGGLETLASLGVAPLAKDEDAFDFGLRIGAALPSALLDMLRAAPHFLRSGQYLFCHAGVRPGVALRNQTELDLMFIRDTFLESKTWHGARIVHGHSIVEQVDVRDNRIAVDTGAYRTGRLSCVRLQDDRVDVLSVERDAAIMAEPATAS